MPEDSEALSLFLLSPVFRLKMGKISSSAFTLPSYTNFSPLNIPLLFYAKHFSLYYIVVCTNNTR